MRTERKRESKSIEKKNRYVIDGERQKRTEKWRERTEIGSER